MRVMIAGGSGLIGRQLTKLLTENKDEVIILSRHPEQVSKLPQGVIALQWDGKAVQDWVKQVERSDVIVNLTGENLSGKGFLPSRWTIKRKERLVNSRLDSGKVLTQAVEQATQKPTVFVQASGIGYYGTSVTKTFSEDDNAGHDFMANLAVEWEDSTRGVESFGVRRVIVRNGVVLSTLGGALPSLILPYKLMVGGRLGDGAQVYSWIHIRDEVRAIQFLIGNQIASGAFNLTSPNPVTNNEFGQEIGKSIHRPHYFPIPSFAMKLAFGEVADMVLEGQRVIPKKLLDLGFKFEFPTLDLALKDLISSEERN